MLLKFFSRCFRCAFYLNRLFSLRVSYWVMLLEDKSTCDSPSTYKPCVVPGSKQSTLYPGNKPLLCEMTQNWFPCSAAQLELFNYLKHVPERGPGSRPPWVTPLLKPSPSSSLLLSLSSRYRTPAPRSGHTDSKAGESR